MYSKLLMSCYACAKKSEKSKEIEENWREIIEEKWREIIEEKWREIIEEKWREIIEEKWREIIEEKWRKIKENKSLQTYFWEPLPVRDPNHGRHHRLKLSLKAQIAISK
jgi:hypothetical protein